MSRSNPTETKHIARKYFTWSGDAGGWKYYDKTKGEKGENVTVPMPFRFLVLDVLATIKGWSDADQSGYWSNEVRNVKTDTLTVRNKKGIAATGTYQEILNNRACDGVKYCQSVYIAYKEEDGNLSICNLQILGAALGSWISFCK